MQDPLVSNGANLVPLLGIDVWEHAYYLQVSDLQRFFIIVPVYVYWRPFG